MRERVSGGVYVCRFQTLTGAGDNDRGVLAVGAGEDWADPRRLLGVDREVGRVDSVPCQRGAESIAEDIAADAADEERSGRH